MTIRERTHGKQSRVSRDPIPLFFLSDDLNNAGAYQAKVYLDKVAEKVAEKTGADKTKTSSGAGTSAQKHKAIFVTPGVDSRCWPQK
jgi:hypothetical protein